jgi:hypothetical protein
MTTLKRTLVGSIVLAALVGAATASAEDPAAPLGPFAGAVHATLQVLYVDGSSGTRTLDRGKVTASIESSLTLSEVGGASVAFTLDAQTHVLGGTIAVGDRAAVLGDGSGHALAIRVRHGKQGAAKGQALGTFKTVAHASVDATLKTGTTKSFVYDRGQILTDVGGTLVVKRRDGVSVTLSIDSSTVVKEKGHVESIDDLVVGERAMFFSDSSGHVFLVRCISKAKVGTGS